MRRRRRRDDRAADANRWLGTYGDMVTLLMAFFVMLFAVSDTNPIKFESFVQGLAGPFNNPSVEMGLITGQAVDRSDSSPIEMLSTPLAASADSRTWQEVAERSIEDAEAAAAASAQLAEVEAQLESALAGVDLPISADIRDDERGLVVAITTDDVLFETGSTTISQVGRELLAEIAPVLVDAPNTVVVEGHTDDQPLDRGGYSNWNLSTDRAVAVLTLLGDAHGLPYDRVSAAGYGEHRPIDVNDTAEGRAHNRRVEILIVALDRSPAAGVAPPAPAGPPVLDFSEPLPVSGGGTSIAEVLDAG